MTKSAYNAAIGSAAFETAGLHSNAIGGEGERRGKGGEMERVSE